MKRKDFIAAHGVALAPTHDYQLYDFCIRANYGELLDRHGGPIDDSRTYAAKYGYNDNDMIGFTVAVERRLNASLEAVGRGLVVLPTGPGQVIPASTTIRNYSGRIYAIAKAQNP